MNAWAVHGRRSVPVLWVLLVLFALRVLGQVLVVFADARWLPPMGQWQSGILPYPVLLASQIVILLLLVKVCADCSRGDGYFATTRPWFGRAAMWFGVVYFASMLVRYAVRMLLHPEARWLDGTIPIFFHCVLATFIMVFARSHRAAPAGCTAPRP